MNLHIFAVIVLAILVFCYAQNDGWKMTDRFYGFRYELQGKGLGTAMQQQIQNQADINGCFGWVQISKYSDSLVGEARCSKGRGPAFKEWISTLTNVDKADTLVRFPHEYNTLFIS